ncbi:GPI mannosyltransferase 2 [Aphelenchoides bicaudatus]|nr:GPI mannosyltransferase 2 [Aphelenchoides bicaudatus]
MGRKAVVRSRKNTNTLNKLETVKHILANSGGIGVSNNQHVAGWKNSNAPPAMSRSSSLETDEGDYEAADFNDTDLVTPQIYSFVTKQLIRSRLILIFLQWFFNWIIPDFSTDAFKGFEPTNSTKVDTTVQSLIGGFARWDARHFLHIAEFDYTWESTLAFFPFFPMLLRVTGSTLQWSIGSISLFNAMIVSGVVINNVLFVVNGLLLFKLCLVLTKNTKESLIAVYVFCFNPASIFFSSVYTESIYMSFTLMGLIVIYEQSGYVRLPIAACLFSFAYATRANGILNFGYIGFALLIETVVRKDSDDRLVIEQSTWKLAEKSLKRLPILLACLLIVILPLRIFGWSMEERYCKSTLVTVNERLLPTLEQNSTAFVLPGKLDSMPWCDENRPVSLFFPAYYADVQNKYWDVGFLHYWQLRKILMFLIASPTLGFVLYGFMDFIIDIGTDRRNFAEAISDQRYLIPFVIHSSIIGLSGFLFYNVEVSIRMLYSSSPFLYILLARIMSNQTPRILVPQDVIVPTLLPFFANYIFVRPLHFFMMLYILGYFFFGTLLHVNWLPFV